MEEALSLAQKLSVIGFGPLAALLLFGGYWGVWAWGRQLVELKADYETRLKLEREEKAMWRTMALEATGLAKHGVVLAQQQIEKGPPA